MALLPRRFGRYEILDEIARGAHGIVYRARDTELDRTVALKLLRTEAASRTAAERFQREARVIGRLHHSDIMGIFEAGTEEGRPFFAMPLVEGTPLSWLIITGALDTKRAAGLMERLARAAHFAHERGVLHRDLKPANVFVRADGSPVIMDFGVARDDGDAARLTKAGELLGTPMYMAPEQIAGRTGEVDARTDVYALGAILYEILARRPPFEARTFADLSSKVLNDEPPPPSQVNLLADADLGRICLRCLRKDPRERYQTALELAEDLARVACGARVRVPGETTRAQAVRLARRYRLTLVAALGALAGTALGLTAGAFSRSGAATGGEVALARIVTEPADASVYADGRFLGATPLTIPAFTRVSLRKAGFAESIVSAREGETQVRLVWPGEIPAGMVYAPDIELFADRHEVTAAEYARFIASSGRRPPPSWKRGAPSRGQESRPVTEVSWEDAQAYAVWAGKRLPTVEEWRAIGRGATGPMTCAPSDGPLAVGGMPADCSLAGCLDVLGNVREWTATARSASGDIRVACGGSWERDARECTVDRAEERPADYRGRDLGFRCVMDPPWRRNR